MIPIGSLIFTTLLSMLCSFLMKAGHTNVPSNVVWVLLCHFQSFLFYAWTFALGMLLHEHLMKVPLLQIESERKEDKNKIDKLYEDIRNSEKKIEKLNRSNAILENELRGAKLDLADEIKKKTRSADDANREALKNFL